MTTNVLVVFYSTYGHVHQTDGRMVAVSKAQCAALAGTVELPFEGGIRPQTPKP